MTLYFFNVRYKPGASGVVRDPDGDEIASLDQVRPHALTVARDLIARTRLDSLPNWFDCSFEVTDEEGQPVMTVPFGDIVSDHDEDPARY